MAQFKNPLTNPQGFLSSQPGGFFAPPKNKGFEGILSDPRLSIGMAIAQGQPIGQALLGGAIQAKEIEAAMFPDKEFGTTKLAVNADGGVVFATEEEIQTNNLTPYVEGDDTNDYQNYLRTVDAGAQPTPEGFRTFLLEDATAGATKINLSEKADLILKGKFYDAQIKDVQKDIDSTTNWFTEKTAIDKMEAGLSRFETGFLGSTRAYIGSILSFINEDYRDGTKKVDDLFNAEGAQLTTTGAATFQRELARGLQNLNLEEVKINKRITTGLTKEPYVNQVILETLRIDNDAKRDINNLTKEFLATKITYEEYLDQKNKIRTDATTDANNIFDFNTNIAKAIPTIIRDNIGEIIEGYNLQNEVVKIKVQATDKFSGQSDMQDRPIMVTVKGEMYVLTVFEDTN